MPSLEDLRRKLRAGGIKPESAPAPKYACLWTGFGRSSTYQFTMGLGVNPEGIKRLSANISTRMLLTGKLRSQEEICRTFERVASRKMTEREKEAIQHAVMEAIADAAKITAEAIPDDVGDGKVWGAYGLGGGEEDDA